MKIYPSRHIIEDVENVNTETDIPLAYVDLNAMSYDIRKTNELEEKETVPIIPYQAFDSLDKCFFRRTKSVKENTFNYHEIEKYEYAQLLQNNGDEYQYIPNNSITFFPDRFYFTAIAKKKIKYNNRRLYNIKASCIDDPSDGKEPLKFAKTLIKVLGDAPRRNICPSNINVNEQDISIERLTSGSIADSDLVFLESLDGKHYMKYTMDGHEENTGEIDFDSFLKENTNLWISLENSEDNPITEQYLEEEFNLKSANVLNVEDIESRFYFEMNKQKAIKGVTYHNLFKEDKCPVLLLEHSKKGFIILSHRSFLNNIETNKDLFYEVMMYVYMNSYIRSKTINQWITNEMPDYIVSNKKLTKKDDYNHNYKLSELFDLNSNELVIADMKIEAEREDVKVNFAGIVDDNITFEKDQSSKVDDKKPEGYISIFTPRQNIIYYKEYLYAIEDSVQDKIKFEINNNILTIIVDNIKNTEKAINSSVFKYEMNIKEVSETVSLYRYLYSRNNIISIENKKSDEYGTLLSVITIQRERKVNNIPKIYDIRQRGGGLPEKMEDDYNLLDIGHLYGRPYRKAGTLIITLPKELKPYEDLILKAVSKHMVAEDLPIILFE